MCWATIVDDRESRACFSRFRVPAQTTMFRYLPPEILDLVVDHLQGEPTTLGACCVVSKSWVPQTRRHLFAHVEFNTFGPSIELRIAVFPDPLNSPAHYTRTLTVIGLRSTTGTGTDVIPWVRAFHNVVCLDVQTLGRGSHELFYGLSPVVRSFHLEAPKAKLSEISVLFVPSPFSTISHYSLSVPSPKTMTGPLPRPSRGSPGLSC